jgi:NADPH:quinone reductase-like Zn-dependent oxidoreductase
LKAIVQHEYGPPLDVLKLEDVDKPVPGDDEVLVRVAAAAVNAFDPFIVTGIPYFMRVAGVGLRAPKNPTPGLDVAGRVEAVGKHVTRFKPGDEVFGWAVGSFAEYACAPESKLVPKPASINLEQAAAVPVGACTALVAIRDYGQVKQGQKVLITGASGGVGTFAIQLAKIFGAHVTGTCSTRNLEMVRSIGADRVIDYTQEDFTKSGERYDVIFDIAGRPSLSGCRRSLTPGGTLVIVGGVGGGAVLGPLPRFARAQLLSVVKRPHVRITASAKETVEDGLILAEFLESGKLTPVIDRTYDLSDAPAAVEYMREGHTQGKVVITVDGRDR